MKYSIFKNKKIMLIFCLLALMFFWGCADEFKNEKKDAFLDKWTTLAENSQGHSPSAQSKKIDNSVLTTKQVTSAQQAGEEVNKLPTSPIHLTMRQADLKAVLRAMAKSVNLNLLVKNELKGEISVDFKGVAWDEAFNGLLRTYGLSYVWEGGIVRVMTIDDIDQELKRKVQLRDIQWVEPTLDPVVIGINYADPNKLAPILNDLLTKDKDGKPRGSIKVDEHSNSLIISALRDDLKKVLPMIENLDKPTSQILIKANIVETTKGVARDLGIMWGGYNRSTQGKEDLIVTGGGISPTGPIGGTGTIPPQRSGLGVNLPAGAVSDLVGGSLGLLFGRIDGNLLEVQLQALQNDNKLNILSSPSITTLDNQKAFTENGEKVPFVVRDKDGTLSTSFETVVLRLEITPHVIDGKNLKMTIVVRKDEVDSTRTSPLGDPYIIKKETQTSLIVNDGETIVISGLTKQTNLGAQDGIPWLKDIPVLGWVFKSDSRSESMEEVLIFITPHILPVGNG